MANKIQQTVKELHEKRMKMWDESIENHKKYIDSSTGLFLDKYTKERVCPVCSSKNFLKIFSKEGGTYVKCLDCSMIYLNPVFKDEAIIEYYQINHTEQAELVESDTDNFYIDIYNGGLDSIQKATSSISNILDIGCSSGTFLDLARQRNLTTYGIELNKAEFEFAKNKGHKVFNDLLENITFDTKFNAITMWDVFEHIINGEFYLNLMKCLLNENGVIFLQIPSSDSLAAKILQEHCNMYDGLEHVNLYGVETIKKLAHKCNLEVLSLKTVISEIGVINNYLNYENPYIGNTKNKEFIANLIDEKKLHETLQGYKLQVILGEKK
ncbi:MAG: class I SAM-dependent methyltransferase [Arcobacteraceae bacterium]|nr:class I SAM-dependent methyltransferase [Arcobacteraceae bacterium]